MANELFFFLRLQVFSTEFIERSPIKNPNYSEISQEFQSNSTRVHVWKDHGLSPSPSRIPNLFGSLKVSVVEDVHPEEPEEEAEIPTGYYILLALITHCETEYNHHWREHH